MTAKIFIVMGSTGEYSDRTEWPVMAFLTEAEAKKHEDDCLTEAIRLGASSTLKKPHYDSYAHDGEKSKFDPDMQCSYTGVGYFIMDCPFTAPKPSFLLKTTGGYLKLNEDRTYNAKASKAEATRFATKADAEVWTDGENDEVVSSD